MKPTLLTLACLMLAVTLTGCIHARPAGIAAASEVESGAANDDMDNYAPESLPEPPAIPRELNAVEFLDDELISDVLVQNTRHTRTGGNTFEVQATFKNLTDETVRMKVRTQYFDASRQHQEGPGAWKLLFIPGNGIETYKTYTYRSDTEYYLIEAAPLDK